MVLREISKTTDASVILPVFSQYARTFLRKSNEYAISILNHKCTIFISFYYISKIIYNGIIEFAENEFNIDYQNLDIEQAKVILTKLRYRKLDSPQTKLQYGF